MQHDSTDDQTLDTLQRHLDEAMADAEFTGTSAPPLRVEVRELRSMSAPHVVELVPVRTTLSFEYDQQTVRIESTNPYLGIQARRVVTVDGPGEVWPISFAC